MRLTWNSGVVSSILEKVLLTAALGALLFPFSFIVRHDGSVFILWRDATAIALLCFAFSFVFWGAWLGIRKLRRGTRQPAVPDETRYARINKRDAPYNIFGPMEPRLRRRLALAVFLTFSIIGPIGLLMNTDLSPVPLPTFVFVTLTTGFMSASFVLFGHRKLLLVVAFGSCMILNSNLADISRNIFGDPATTSVSIEQQPANIERLRDVNDQRLLFGITGILLLSAGYATWIAVISKEGATRKQYQTEIGVARRIQQQLLPSGEFATEWLEAAGTTLTATDVGGDYFDFIRIDRNRVACVIADVAGHGIGAGILSAMVKSAVRSQLLHDASPVAVLANLNAIIHQVAERKMFSTCAYVLFDRDRMTARIATAGHPPVCLRNAEGKIIEYRTRSLALGMREEGGFSEVEVPLSSGDTVCLYTDGVTEATNPQGEQFEMARLQRAIHESASLRPQEATTHIVQSVRNFREKNQFVDDATVICVRLLTTSAIPSAQK